jgi:hypothetical protein
MHLAGLELEILVIFQQLSLKMFVDFLPPPRRSKCRSQFFRYPPLPEKTIPARRRIFSLWQLGFPAYSAIRKAVEGLIRLGL